MQPLEQFLHQIEREAEAPPIEAHGYRVQPIAQIRGWWGELPTDTAISDTGAHASGGGAFLQVTPVAVEVEQAGQAPYRIALTAADQPALKGLVIGGIAIALTASLINLLIRLRYG